MSLDKLFTLMAERKASDLFLSAGSPINIKIDGVSLPLNQEPLQPAHVVSLLASRLSDEQFRELEEERELNVALPLKDVGSFRLSAFIQRGSISAVIRFIPSDIPKVDDLGLPPALKDIVMERRGLILVVGAAGSGKSTTIASLLDYRNQVCTGHIMTFEDPIEFNFRNRKSIVNQREIGTDTHSMAVALRNATRQSPDVLFIGEIRDRDAMSAALSYALSGHLLVATMHAINSAHALSRVISFYPPETRQALHQDLAAALKAIVSQRLVRHRRGGRLAAAELLLNSGHATELIERGDVPALKAAMEQSLTPGSTTFEQSLYQLLLQDVITRDEALGACDSRNNLLYLINNAGKLKAAEEKPAEPEPPSFTEITLNL